jgi:hypothetical protein
MNKICIGARNHNAVAGLPLMVNPSLAALTFAGNIASNITINASPAASRVFEINNPIAPSNSHTPVKYTIGIGRGNVLGTIAAISCFVLVKCATPVNMNMNASAKRAESCQLANLSTPSAPIPRNTSHDANSTIKTAMTLPPDLTGFGFGLPISVITFQPEMGIISSTWCPLEQRSFML